MSNNYTIILACTNDLSKHENSFDMFAQTTYKKKIGACVAHSNIEKKEDKDAEYKKYNKQCADRCSLNFKRVTHTQIFVCKSFAQVYRMNFYICSYSYFSLEKWINR